VRSAIVWLALLATTVAATALSPDAPADEYFGPFKYSAISVRTKIDALGRSYRERWADDASIVHDAQLVESSFRVWAQRYPKDKWLAPTAYHLAQLYQEVQTPDARNHALAMYRYVAQAFPSSKEAHYARLRLSQGLPPIHPESPVSPTPNPYASANPSGSSAPASETPAASPASPSAAPASAAPAASRAPGATPAASAPPSVASPAPSPTAKPKR
jgi:hypothetical protein